MRDLDDLPDFSAFDVYRTLIPEEGTRVLGDPERPLNEAEVIEVGSIAWVRRDRFKYHVEVPDDIEPDVELAERLHAWVDQHIVDADDKYDSYIAVDLSPSRSKHVFTNNAIMAGLFRTLAEHGIAGVEQFMALYRG